MTADDPYPFLRQVRSPVTPEDLRPLDARCRVVQFSEPLTDEDHAALAGLLERHPEVPLRVYGHHGQGTDLGFLRHYPRLGKFSVEVFELRGLEEGLERLPADLRLLSIGATRSKRFSLASLRRFRSLTNLHLEAQTKGIEVLAELGSLRHLSLRSITLTDLSLLTSLDRLRTLELKLGGTTDLGLLPRVGELRYLEIYLVRNLADLSAVAETATLRFLFLQSLRNVTELPSFRRLERLERVHLETMKGLVDLGPVAEAPALEQLLVLDAKHLEPEALRPFVGHPTLRQATVGLGAVGRNRAVEELLGLPRADPPEDLLAECFGEAS